MTGTPERELIAWAVKVVEALAERIAEVGELDPRERLAHTLVYGALIKQSFPASGFRRGEA